MVSRTITKFIKSLQLKKYRKLEQLFLVEGDKSVVEVLQSTYKVRQVLSTQEFQERYPELLKSTERITANERELSAMGNFRTNNSAIAVVEMSSNTPFEIADGFGIVLDDVNDPGNLGTIIRVADWYGFSRIVASLNTADLYNPKVISASKGSFTRVRLYYTDLSVYLKEANVPIFGAFMEGDSVHKIEFRERGLIVMGNESNGISDELSPLISKRISIPRYGQAESLNVGVATAVICDNLRRST
ncbi:MAG: RNA methyltransferase [Bacteroidota bacterium]